MMVKVNELIGESETAIHSRLKDRLEKGRRQLLFCDAREWTNRLTIAQVELDELLRFGDVVSLHLALTDEARGFFERKEFAQLKASAILSNTAGGPVVDQVARSQRR